MRRASVVNGRVESDDARTRSGETPLGVYALINRRRMLGKVEEVLPVKRTESADR